MENTIDNTKDIVSDEVQTEEVQTEEVQTEEVKMSKEDYEKAIKSEGDKRVSQALKTSQAKWEQEYKEKLIIEKEEATKLAKMSESDRQIALFEAEKSKFAEERKLYQREKLELQVVKELSTKSLPAEFSKYLIGEDAETCMSNIKEFDLHWQQAIANVVDARLRGSTPKGGSGNVPTVNPWKEGQINLTQQGKIWRENHELARTLMNNN